MPSSGVNLAQAFVRIEAPISRLTKDFDKAEQRTKRFTRRAGSHMKGFGQSVVWAAAKVFSLQKALQLAGRATRTFNTFIKDSVIAAADVVETMNLARISFGRFADDAEDWARGLNRSFDLVEADLLKTSGTFKLFFENIGLAEDAAFDMSKAVTQLGIDLSSFRNLPLQEAFRRITAGLSGEIEPLRKLGIVIDDQIIKLSALNRGIIQQGEEMTQAQKVMERFHVLMLRTKKDQGDLARTFEQTQNQMRRWGNIWKTIRQTVGREFLVPFTKNLERINEWLSQNMDLWKIWAKSFKLNVSDLLIEAGVIVENVFGKQLGEIDLAEIFAEGIKRSREFAKGVIKDIGEIVDSIGTVAGAVKHVESAFDWVGGVLADVKEAFKVLQDIDRLEKERIQSDKRNRALNRRLKQPPSHLVPGAVESMKKHFEELNKKLDVPPRSFSQKAGLLLMGAGGGGLAGAAAGGVVAGPPGVVVGAIGGLIGGAAVAIRELKDAASLDALRKARAKAASGVILPAHLANIFAALPGMGRDPQRERINEFLFGVSDRATKSTVRRLGPFDPGFDPLHPLRNIIPQAVAAPAQAKRIVAPVTPAREIEFRQIFGSDIGGFGGGGPGPLGGRVGSPRHIGRPGATGMSPLSASLSSDLDTLKAIERNTRFSGRLR